MAQQVTAKEFSDFSNDTTAGKDSTKRALAKIKRSYRNLHAFDFPITWEYAYQVSNRAAKPLEELSFSEKMHWMGSQFTLEKIIGFFITTLAASIGAPIWYDIIQKLIAAREILKKTKT